jgi:hypothetical protein
MGKIIRFSNNSILPNEKEIINSRTHSEEQIHSALLTLGSNDALRKYYDCPISDRDIIIADVNAFLDFYLSNTSDLSDRFRQKLINALDTENSFQLCSIIVYILGTLSQPIDEEYEEDIIRQAALIILINLAKSLELIGKIKVYEEQ